VSGVEKWCLRNSVGRPVERIKRARRVGWIIGTGSGSM